MIRALLLDLDGTLYDQRALYRKMSFELLRSYWKAPFKGYRTARVLMAYRRAQETLRSSDASGDLAALQLELARGETGCNPDFAAACVREWMEEAPLRHLAGCTIPAVPELLEFARRAGIRVALCSDYPARRKLEAMGIARFFDQVICAQDAEVGRLKPNPKILQVALGRLAVPPSEALYAGDRPDVDGAAATRAGIGYVNIVCRPSHGSLTIAGLLEKIRA